MADAPAAAPAFAVANTVAPSVHAEESNPMIISAAAKPSHRPATAPAIRPAPSLPPSELAAPTPRLPHRLSTVSQAEIVTAASRVCDHDVEVRIAAMKALCHHLPTQETQLPPADIDRLVSSLAGQLNVCLGSTNTNVPCRLSKHVLNTLIQFFQRRTLVRKVSDDSLASILGEVIFLVASNNIGTSLDPQFEPSVILNALQRLLMLALDTAQPNKLFTLLLQFLYEAQPPVALAGRQTPQFTEWVLRCLLKITRALPQGISDVSIDQLLWDVHLFLCAHPPSKYRNKEFMPLRLLKTVICCPFLRFRCGSSLLVQVLNELVKLKGDAIRSHLYYPRPILFLSIFHTHPCCRTLIPVESQPTIVTCVSCLFLVMCPSFSLFNVVPLRYLDLLLQSAGNCGATIDGGSPKLATPASPKLPSKNRGGASSTS